MSQPEPSEPKTDGTSDSDPQPPPFSPQSDEQSKPLEGGTGEGVDRKIETPWFTPKRIALAVALVAAVGALAYAVWTTATGGRVLNVDRERVTISTVEQGDFQEFIAVTGTVVPEQTVYLDAVEGGRVEEILVEEGTMVEKGARILRLSNNDLRRRVLDSETRVAEQQNNMERLQLEMEQQSLNLQEQMADIRYQITQLEREYDRQLRLYEQDLTSEEEYQSVRDELEYQRRRLELTRSAYVQDSLAQASRLESMRQTEERLQRTRDVLRESLDNLTVEAPIAGQLTALNADLGEIVTSGTRLGQVDRVDAYELRAQIDEFYIDRVRHGQTATTDALGDTTRTLTVDRVYPEVEEGRFEVDLAFSGTTPSDLRRGQTVRLKLQLGQSEQATLLPRGGFYQSTGGNWAYVLTDDGDTAVRRPIRLGRQNPDYFEVLGGLEPGDRVVTSSYDTFGDADRLSLN